MWWRASRPSSKGFDTRFVVTSLAGAPQQLYETVYCARGQAENLIKLHKTQLASDRTSCQSPRANQFRLILHTCAYWLMHGLRAAAPKASEWARAEFATLRLRLVKIAARVVERTTPHPRLAAHRLSRKGDLRAHRLAPRAALTGGAMCPRRTPQRQPPTVKHAV